MDKEIPLSGSPVRSLHLTDTATTAVVKYGSWARRQTVASFFDYYASEVVEMTPRTVTLRQDANQLVALIQRTNQYIADNGANAAASRDSDIARCALAHLTEVAE